MAQDGSLSGRIAVDTPVADGPDAIVEACRGALVAARHMAATSSAGTADAAEDVSPAALGISSPGPVDPLTGVVLEPPNLGPGFRDIALADRLGSALGLPAVLDRDTNVAALAEGTFGAARDCADYLYLTVSTGIGGSIVSGDRILYGPDGFAGELGHVPVSLDGPRCGCGGVGHLEAVASGTALARDARAAATPAAAGSPAASPFLAARATAAGGPERLTARDVGDGEAAADPICVTLMARARRAIATACVGYVNALNPHLIVVGGSIAEAQGDRLLDEIRAAIETEAFRVLAERVTVVPAGLGADVSLIGAVPLVARRLGSADPAGRPHPSTQRNHNGGTPR